MLFCDSATALKKKRERERNQKLAKWSLLELVQEAMYDFGLPFMRIGENKFMFAPSNAETRLAANVSGTWFSHAGG